MKLIKRPESVQKKTEKQKEKTEKCYAKKKNKIINKQKVVGKSVTGKTDPSSNTIQQQQQKNISKQTKSFVPSHL